MTARAGDALSRVYLMRCRTSISSLRKQHFPALFFGRIGCRDLTLRRATRTGTVGRKPIYSARICMGPCASGTPRIRFPPFTCASLTVAREDFIQRYL